MFQQLCIMVALAQLRVVCSMADRQPLYLSLESGSIIFPWFTSSLTFLSQPFWANMVHAAGAGPRPIDHKSLTTESLSQAIEVLLHPDTVLAAERIAEKMKHETGVKEAVKSFHRNLPFQQLNCDMIARQPATWCWKKGKRTLKLSHRAASILVEHKKIEVSSLKMYVISLLLAVYIY
jgi:hypothetical protein